MERCVAGFVLLLASASVCEAQARRWTDNSGKFSVEAELVEVKGDMVVLKKPDGSVVPVPIARLSEADRRYLKSLQEPPRKESAADVGAAQPSEPAISGPKASGKIHGQDFTPDRAELERGVLTLRQGKDTLPDLAMKIFLFLDENETPEGRTYNVTARRCFGASSPHIHMMWKEPSSGFSKSEMFMDGYTMKLEFGRASGGKLPGKIDLRLPEKSESRIAGTFTVVMPGETREAGTGEISGKIAVPKSSKDPEISVGCLGRNPEGKLEAPGIGLKLDGPSSSGTCLTWKPRNTTLSWDAKANRLTHKHVNRPPGWYLVYVRGNRRDLPRGGFSYDGYYDWKWVEIKGDKSKVTVDLTIDPGNLGTVEVTLSGPTKASAVTYLPLDENGQMPFPDAHGYKSASSSAKIEGGKAVIRGLREGKYQIAVGPWQHGTLLPAAKADVEVKRGSTTRVELTPRSTPPSQRAPTAAKRERPPSTSLKSSAERPSTTTKQTLADTGQTAGFAAYGQRALRFKSRPDHISAPHIPFDELDSFTIEAWVKGSWNSALVSQHVSGDPENGIWMTMVCGEQPEQHETCGWESGKGKNYSYPVDGSLPPGWNHLAMVHDGQQQRHFVNGKLVGQKAAPKPGPLDKTRPFLIGVHHYPKWKKYGSGILGSVRVSKVARYGSNFTPSPQFTVDKDTELLYVFSEGQGTTVRDLSGQSRDGNIEGTVWVNP